MKSEDQVQKCILQWLLMFVSFGTDCQDVGNYSTSREVRTWCILAQVITDFCCFQQRDLHGIRLSKASIHFIAE